MADAVQASTDAIRYFGNLPKLYSLFSAMPQRWSILKEHVTVALKTWRDTSWQRQINSIEAAQSRASNIGEALLEVGEKVTDPLTKV